MSQLFTNNASGTLSVQAEIVDTTLTLQGSEGSLFPSPTGGDFFQVSLEDTSGNLEICTCTSRATDVLTVTRAQENTSALVFPTGSRVELRFTAATHDSFLQVYGGVMQGTLDMNNEVIQDPVITDGQINNTPIRGTDQGTGNELLVPTAGGDPTIGGNTIVHTGNDSSYALGATVLTGGEGLAAIGDLSASRTIDLDITELTALSGTAVAGDDDFLVYDTDASEHKRIPYQQAGVPVITDSGQTITPTDVQANSFFICTHSAAAIDFEIDTGVGEKGNIFIIQQSDATRQVTVGGTATINSAHAGPTSARQYSVLTALCTATDVWTVYGDGQ
jgi:hypothetical protein